MGLAAEADLQLRELNCLDIDLIQYLGCLIVTLPYIGEKLTPPIVSDKIKWMLVTSCIYIPIPQHYHCSLIDDSSITLNPAY
jgi:hypothetical protein